MHPTVHKCKFCGRLYKLYPHQVVEGDPTCCSFCNMQADEALQDPTPYYPPLPPVPKPPYRVGDPFFPDDDTTTCPRRCLPWITWS
jgi:hypothetical protein